MIHGTLFGWAPHDLLVAALAAETALIITGNHLYNRWHRRRERR